MNELALQDRAFGHLSWLAIVMAWLVLSGKLFNECLSSAPQGHLMGTASLVFSDTLLSVLNESTSVTARDQERLPREKQECALVFLG